MSNTIIGYKGFESDMTCRGMQYKIGETYEMEGPPGLCLRGFHFCRELRQCYEFYPKTDGNRFCIVEILGEVDENEYKACTNKIRIVRELTSLELWWCEKQKNKPFQMPEYTLLNFGDGPFGDGQGNGKGMSDAYYGGGYTPSFGSYERKLIDPLSIVIPI